ncbi:MAG: hypothetical protein P8L68_16785 [Paracoccaceae bacterium]|nr:hypothetical protein [Paracoccaceae bacterium]MDG2260138.1 hypothetical protein [Paracoccaceae bacterium]
MRTTLPYVFLTLFLGLTLSAVLTSPVLAKGDRPTDLISADLDIPERVFIDCFSDVQPDPGKNPSGARQKMNKAVLLPCLQDSIPAITNDLLDEVMDRYRPEGPFHH